jgi:thiamine kinase-like enzyme
LASEAAALVKQLLADESYKAIQKTIIKKTPLIDWIWLLVLIALSLATEWFVRKYNGLL